MIGGLVFYVLSIGPFIWMEDREWLSEAVCESLGNSVYLPLVLLYDHWAPFETFVDWYRPFWEA